MSHDIFAHIFRTLLMYFIVYLVMRLMGKREIGKLSVFDLVISIMIAEIAVFSLEDIKRPLYEGLIPLGVLLVLQVGISYFSLKSRRLRLLFDGKPSVLYSNGQLYKDEMKKQRYNLDDLMLQLREQNIESLDEVEYVILETTGKLTVISKENYDKAKHEKNKQDERENELINKEQQENKVHPSPQIGGKFRYEGLPIPLIMDGKVLDRNLERMDMNRFWLKNQIQAKGHKDFKDVFLCSVNHRGDVYITPPAYGESLE
ncbi:YetF domain-containing protein [Paenibacillus ottowii]